ncbi:MAG: hypothetical protein JWM10_5, partial [Myxococcaceae bacterium]|nr:hypothetical protein [Myxococcaceae bacterium]
MRPTPSITAVLAILLSLSANACSSSNEATTPPAPATSSGGDNSATPDGARPDESTAQTA